MPGSVLIGLVYLITTPGRYYLSLPFSRWGKWGTKNQPDERWSQHWGPGDWFQSCPPSSRPLCFSDGPAKPHLDRSCLAYLSEIRGNTLFWIWAPTKICNLISCWTLEWPLFFALIYKTFLVFICFIVRDVVSLISPLSVWRTCLVHVAKIIYKEAAIW